MYERYHIPKLEMPPLGAPPSKNLVVRSERCMNCGRCEDACIYKVHERDPRDPRVMAEPKSHLCKNCLRCVEDCPQRALTVEYSPEYLALGEGIWTPARVFTIWNEAWTGKIPVFGAGYRGRYVGPGYDSMWTDMSEIVRPTRDGIHGREFISTSVDLGKRVDHLEFDASGRLLTKMPRFVELPLPLVMDLTRMPEAVPASLEGLMQAAETLDTLLIVPVGTVVPEGAAACRSSLVPVFPAGRTSTPSDLGQPRLVELEMSVDWRKDLKALKDRFPESIVGVRVQARNGVEPTAVELAASEADLIHLLFDEQGKEAGAEGRLAKDSLMSVNQALAKQSLREAVSIVAGGGLAAAEHIPKSLICGADALALERALKVALGCHASLQCTACPLDPKQATSEWIKWRAVNMIGAWRDQLLEVMGAMGIREARRLRGEIGRAIFYEEAEKDAFASLQGGE
jgi:ferredoxin